MVDFFIFFILLYMSRWVGVVMVRELDIVHHHLEINFSIRQSNFFSLFNIDPLVLFS